MKIEGKHLVLGNGHLSKELQDMLRKHGIDYEVAGREILSYPEKVPYKEYFEQFGMIWNCIGHGSVGGDSQKQIMAHVGLVDFLLNMDIYQIHFSSNYAQFPEQSFYAYTKQSGEVVYLKKENKKSAMVRVANLCGKGYGIVHKLTQAMLRDEEVHLVTNHVSPTDTRTLAEYLVEEHKQIISECNGKNILKAYSSLISVVNLAIKIKSIINKLEDESLDPYFKIKSDCLRPYSYSEPDVIISTDVATEETVIRVLR